MVVLYEVERLDERVVRVAVRVTHWCLLLQVGATTGSEACANLGHPLEYARRPVTVTGGAPDVIAIAVPHGFPSQVLHRDTPGPLPHPATLMQRLP